MVAGGNAISFMGEVREVVLAVLTEVVERWIELELVFVFEEGGPTPVTERVMGGGGC